MRGVHEFSIAEALVAQPGETLPDDQRERKTYLVEELKDGKAEILLPGVRDLSFFQYGKTLNENDRLVLKQASHSLLGEWEFSLSIPLALAQANLQNLLIKPSQPLANP